MLRHLTENYYGIWVLVLVKRGFDINLTSKGHRRVARSLLIPRSP